MRALARPKPTVSVQASSPAIHSGLAVARAGWIVQPVPSRRIVAAGPSSSARRYRNMASRSRNTLSSTPALLEFTNLNGPAPYPTGVQESCELSRNAPTVLGCGIHAT